MGDTVKKESKLFVDCHLEGGGGSGNKEFEWVAKILFSENKLSKKYCLLIFSENKLSKNTVCLFSWEEDHVLREVYMYYK